MKVARSDEWLTARIGDELLMMRSRDGIYLALSEVGARVWELLETESELDRICEALGCEFDVAPDVCRAEVEAFVQEGAERGVVTIASTSSQ